MSDQLVTQGAASTRSYSVSTAGAAPTHVPGLWGLCLRPMPDVPWQQNVHLPELLYG